MKLVIIFCLVNMGFLSRAQEHTITKYYDSLWMAVPAGIAVYKTEFVKIDTAYRVTSYWARSGKLKSISIYTDTNFTKGVGLLKRYYETGEIEDSSYFNDKGSLSDTYHFYQNGNLYYHDYYDSLRKKAVSMAYDLHGRKLKDFITAMYADFPGGIRAWQNYLYRHMDMQDFHYKTGGEEESKTVAVDFVVNEVGDIINVKVARSSGVARLDEYAVKTIAKSPKWQPAISLNKPVKQYHQQPITCIFY